MILLYSKDKGYCSDEAKTPVVPEGKPTARIHRWRLRSEQKVSYMREGSIDKVFGSMNISSGISVLKRHLWRG